MNFLYRLTLFSLVNILCLSTGGLATITTEVLIEPNLPLVSTIRIKTEGLTALLELKDKYIESFFKIRGKQEYVLVTRAASDYNRKNFRLFLGGPDKMLAQAIDSIKFHGDNSMKIQDNQGREYHFMPFYSTEVSILKLEGQEYALEEVLNLFRKENKPTLEEIKILSTVGTLTFYKD